MKKTIGLIGCGNMGEAIFRGCKKDKQLRLLATDKVKSRKDKFCRKYRIKSACSISDLIRLSDVVLIAVKPQDIDEVLVEIKESLRKNVLVVSIAAGISSKYIEKTIGNKVKVIRAMPNMAAVLGESVTAIKKGIFASKIDTRLVKNIFEKVGSVIEVKRDADIDIVTALSGSGPAYFFYIVASFMAVGKERGMDQKKTNELLFKTLIGSAELLKENKFDTKKLIAKVASKGGTTEAALKVFDDNNLKTIIAKGILAAYKRAKQLSR